MTIEVASDHLVDHLEKYFTVTNGNGRIILSLVAKIREQQEQIRRRPEFPELKAGSTYYITQERAFAPGIADGWPEVIPAPHTKNGRLVRRIVPGEVEV